MFPFNFFSRTKKVASCSGFSLSKVDSVAAHRVYSRQALEQSIDYKLKLVLFDFAEIFT